MQPAHNSQPPAAPPAGEFDAERWIQLERLRLVYANLPVILFVTIASACILALLLQSVVETTELLIWLGAGSLITLLRYVHYVQFKRLDHEVDADAIDARTLRRRLDAGVAISGMFWGYAGVGLFPPGDLAHQVFITFVLAGLSAGAMTSYSAIRSTYFLFVLPAIVPVMLRMAFEQTEIHYSMALLTLLFLPVLDRKSVV